MQFPDEKDLDLDIKVYMEMIDEYKAYAKENGFTLKETDLFVKKSIANSIQAEYEAVFATKIETKEHIAEIFKKLGIEA